MKLTDQHVYIGAGIIQSKKPASKWTSTTCKTIRSAVVTPRLDPRADRGASSSPRWPRPWRDMCPSSRPHPAGREEHVLPRTLPPEPGVLPHLMVADAFVQRRQPIDDLSRAGRAELVLGVVAAFGRRAAR